MNGLAKTTLAAGAFSAGLAVAFGAFGAHALVGRVPDDLLVVYETAARYHFYHSLGLLVVGLLALYRGANGAGAAARPSASSRLLGVAVLMLTGIVLFSGSLYTMALTGERWLGAITPFGGLAFLAAWGLLAWEALD
jgi:uncharacterized membrane protein YgdD (TMEM256/DUF423 family)